uniref:Uncharacterized protein n=1 Tax=Anopheles melas TaxID=34690 RepID=A0A182UJK1_9DIPT
MKLNCTSDPIRGVDCDRVRNAIIITGGTLQGASVIFWVGVKRKPQNCTPIPGAQLPEENSMREWDPGRRPERHFPGHTDTAAAAAEGKTKRSKGVGGFAAHNHGAANQSTDQLAG